MFLVLKKSLSLPENGSRGGGLDLGSVGGLRQSLLPVHAAVDWSGNPSVPGVLVLAVAGAGRLEAP